MQINWQSPYSLQGATLTSLSSDAAAENAASRLEPTGGRHVGRDRFDYWLIFSICLPIFFWVALIERSVPQFWSASAGAAARLSLWALAKQHAHRCAKLALQG